MRGFMPRVAPGTKIGPGGPAGFPTLSTLAVTPLLKAAGVEVFGQPSKKQSLILQVKVRTTSNRASHLIVLQDGAMRVSSQLWQAAQSEQGLLEFHVVVILHLCCTFAQVTAAPLHGCLGTCLLCVCLPCVSPLPASSVMY